MSINLPKSLVEQIRNGQVVLFLGAGASFGALHSSGKQLPLSQQLCDSIVEKFLPDTYRGYPLAQVAELAISETDLFTVQQFIADIFIDFFPANFHKIIPRIPWKAIFTTNYDLLVERAYDEVKNSVQQAVVFKKDGERIEEKLRGHGTIPYIKLHGCITNINDDRAPLILTSDQYITHRSGRKRLFERLESLSSEYPILFVGYGYADSDLRAILIELGQLGDAKPRSYMVNPSFTPEEIRLWTSRKIECLTVSFKDFLEEIDQNLGSLRSLVTSTSLSSHAIEQRIATGVTAKPSPSLLAMLDDCVDYIHNAFPTKKVDPKAFYKGYFADWSPIDLGLDVRRRITDDILSEIFLISEDQRSSYQEVYVLRGFAGSGKTVILHRLAWDAAKIWEKLCLFVKPSSVPEYDALFELYALCKERIFLFIDPATDYQQTIIEFIKKARRDRLPLTIICAERFSEWNAYCEDLYPFINGHYELRNLSKREIEELLELLKLHKSLGHLAGMAIEDQKKALETHAGRQILVALHEATLGKPFSDIVLDEYESIVPAQAQSLYLTVCVLHRLNISTRAGLISRVHNIPFPTFKERLFMPLEFIIFTAENKRIGDYEYRTRHQHIANEVFERVLVNQQERYEEYIRILSALDVDFQSDRDAFVRMTNARELKTLFLDRLLISQIYDVAKSRSPKDAFLLQQQAIFEMSAGDAGVNKAAELLREARSIAPWNPTLDHSLAELALRKSELAKADFEKNKFRQEARSITAQLLSKGQITSHAYHTLIKIGLVELEESLYLDDESISDKKVREVETIITKALQAFPDDEFLLDADAKFNAIINNHPKAILSLKKAFDKNKTSSFIASRLANALVSINESLQAVDVLREALNQAPHDKNLHYQLARLLMIQQDHNDAEIKHHLRNSFTKGDSNHSAQFWYARHLYIEGNEAEARPLFLSLWESNVDIRIKNELRGCSERASIPIRYSGTVVRQELSYLFIKRDGYNDDIFAHREKNLDSWSSVRPHQRVAFEIHFTYRGPVAVNISPER